MNRLAEAVHKRRQSNLEILELHSGDHDFASSLFPKATLQKAFQNFTDNLGYKPDPKGDARARQAISDFYKETFEYRISPDQIILTSGSSESYAWIFRILASGNESILAPTPSYPLFEHIADFSRIQLVQDSIRLPVEKRSRHSQIRERQKSDRETAALAVSPANPSGAVLTKEQLAELEARTDVIVFDEVFSSYIWNDAVSGRNFPRPGQAKLRFTLNGISKLLVLPWLKLSWILVEGEAGRVSDALNRLEFIADTFLPVNSFAQFALPDLFQARSEFMPSYVDRLNGQRHLTLSAINGTPGFHAQSPEGGFTIVVSFEDRIGLDEEDFAIQLLEKTGVHVYPGYYFDIEGGRSFIISFQQKPDMLQRALERLNEFVLEL